MHRKEPFQHRERNGEKDAAVGKQLTFKNVILRCCSWQYESDKYTLNIDVNGGGSGYSDKNGKTGNSAKSEIIRKFKKVCSECNKKRAECKHKEMF